MKKQQSKRVIPGFGLTMGVTLAMLSIVVLIPLASLAVYSARLGFREFIQVITRPRVLSGFYVSFITAFAATVVNAIMGLILAWVLVRYDFPGKRIMDGMIELPFALPTAVAGISLTSLTSDKGLVGSFFAKFGIKIAYTRIGITVALIFVGIPFVVRAIQPVLEKLDGSYEEAARVMGAKPFTIFRRVIFPELLPAMLSGAGLAFGRCLGEYGSVVFIAGNKPYYTEITPLIIMSKLQEFDYESATSIALVTLAVSFLILFGVLLGRFICGFLCPFGWFQDLLHKIPGKKLSTAKLKPLRYLKYVILVVFVILLPAFVTNSLGMGDPFFCKYICPQGVLEGAIPLALANSGIRAALGHLFTFKFTILALFIILSILFYRPFCKWICPLGAIYSLFNKVSFLKIQVDHEKCVGCQKCSRVCKMDVNVVDTPNHPECIRCGECMKACPTDAICYHYGFSNKKKADNK